MRVKGSAGSRVCHFSILVLVFFGIFFNRGTHFINWPEIRKYMQVKEKSRKKSVCHELAANVKSLDKETFSRGTFHVEWEGKLYL